jgi:hypothetical protein
MFHQNGTKTEVCKLPSNILVGEKKYCDAVFLTTYKGNYGPASALIALEYF